MLLGILSSGTAFLYPAYSSFKTLSKRPTDDVELERWTMYWCVLGTLLAIEHLLPLLFYLPFYSLFRTIFLLYLVLPQVQGSTYIYKIHLHPFLQTHEAEIDTALQRAREKALSEGKKYFWILWDSLTTSLGLRAPGQGPPSSAPSATAGAQPTTQFPPGQAGVVPPTSPLATSFQALGNMWKTYGPTLIATGTSFVERQRQSAAGTPVDPEIRKRQLQEELDSLNRRSSAASFSSGSTATGPSFPVPQHTPSSSSASLPGYSASPLSNMPLPSPGGTASNNSSGDERPYEKITREDVVDEHDLNTPSQSRTSWFGWGSPAAKGYEKVKTD